MPLRHFQAIFPLYLQGYLQSLVTDYLLYNNTRHRILYRSRLALRWYPRIPASHSLSRWLAGEQPPITSENTACLDELGEVQRCISARHAGTCRYLQALACAEPASLPARSNGFNWAERTRSEPPQCRIRTSLCLLSLPPPKQIPACPQGS